MPGLFCCKPVAKLYLFVAFLVSVGNILANIAVVMEWYTCTLEVRMPQGLEVQVLSTAPQAGSEADGFFF